MKKLGGIFMGAFCGAVGGVMIGGIPLFACIDFFESTTALEGGMAGLLLSGTFFGASTWKYVTRGNDL